MNLGTRIFLLIAAVLAGSLLLASVLVRHQIREATRHDAEERLETTVGAIEQLARERAERGKAQARLIAAVSPLAEALRAGEATTTQRAVEALYPHLEDVDLLLVLDAEGKPEGAVSEGGRKVKVPPGEVEPIRSALARERSEGVWILGGKLFEIVAVPLEADGERLGAVALGQELQDEVARHLERLTRSHVVILADRQVVASSLSEPLTREAATYLPKLLDGGAREIEVGGRPYLAQLEAVPVDYGGKSCNHLILSPLGRAISLSASILRGLLGVGLVAALFASIAGWLGARQISLPLRDLAERMWRMARTGKLEGGFEDRWRGGREVRLFREAFYHLLVSLGRSQRDRERSYVEAVGAVIAAVDRRDDQSAGHARRVSRFAVALAREMGIADPDELRAIEWGALLHDVGKIAVPDAILRKRGPLTKEEWYIMRQHPRWGYEILADIRFLEPSLDIVYNHHERWDGHGYPRGLRGEKIPLSARIFALVDTYDAITSDRHYRPARNHQTAVLELQTAAGSQFDPEVVEAFLRLPEVEIRRLREEDSPYGSHLRMPAELETFLAQTGLA